MCYDFLPLNFELEKANEYQLNKIDWIKNSPYSETTKKAYFWDINNYINRYETTYKKDLYKFTRDEIESILKSINTTSANKVSRIGSAISSYLDYALDTGLSYTENVMTQIDMRDMIKLNESAIKEAYIPLDEFYEFIDKLDCSENDRLLLLLLRYGCQLKDIPYVMWSDINDKFIHIERNNVNLPVDDKFIRQVEEAKKENEYMFVCDGNKGLKEMVIIYTDYGFIIKQTGRGNDINVKNTSLYTRINNICKRNSMERISVDSLKKMRYYDLLYKIYESNGKLTLSDAKKVVELLDGIDINNKYITDKAIKIRSLFEILSGIKFQQ